MRSETVKRYVVMRLKLARRAANIEAVRDLNTEGYSPEEISKFTRIPLSAVLYFIKTYCSEGRNEIK